MADKASILVTTDELDKACMAFNIALAAAASGMEVVMFFTCWGINLLKKEDLPLLHGEDLITKAMHLFGRGSRRYPKLSRFNMLGLGSWMMRKRMSKVNIQSIPEMIADAKELGVRFLVCENPTTIMGLRREDLIDEVDDIVGAATYVDESAGAELTLII